MKNKIKKCSFIIIFAVIIIFIGMVLLSYDSTLASGAFETEQKELEVHDFWDGVDILLGVLLTFPKAMFLGITELFKMLVKMITAIGVGDGVTSIDQIIFNEASITSVDFFNFNSGNTVVDEIRENVATWYYAIRNLSIVILLLILLYVGIRMAISTVGADEAKYKKMLKDWAVSLALIFVLHYIMIFTIEINNALVDLIGQARTPTDSGSYEAVLDEFSSRAWSPSFNVGIASTLIYMLLVGITILFLLMYIKRMLTVAFLIIISPLITITYSIDKMGDSKSQALNTWLKEFVFNILIQPFHCIIYLVFASIAYNILVTDQTLASAVLAIVMILFIFKAEDMIKQIFGFQSKSLGKAIAGAAAITTGLTFMKNRGDKNSKKKVNVKDVPDMGAKDKVKGGGTTSNKGGNSRISQQNMINGAENNDGIGTNDGKDSKSLGERTSVDSILLSNGGTDDGKAGKKHPVRNLINRARGKVNAGIDGAEKFINKHPVAKGVAKYLATSAKIATVAAAATLGAATGDLKGAISGAYAGGALTKGIGGKLSERKANQLVEKNEGSFAASFKNYQNEQGYTDKQMTLITQQILDGELDSRTFNTDAGADFFASTKQINKTYSAVGDSNSKDRVMETVAMVNSGELEPTYTGKIVPSKPVEEAKKEIKMPQSKSPEARRKEIKMTTKPTPPKK